jgi:hypothetical protein
LFSDDLRATAPIRIQAAREKMIGELFTTTLKSLYPRYVSLWAAGEQSLKDYIGATERLTLKEKRGQRPLTERRKAQIASLFSTGWSTLANRAKSGYMPLMKVDETRGDEAQVTLLLHPMELTTLRAFEQLGQRMIVQGREVPTLEPQQFLNEASREGYRDEEAHWVLKLLAARDLVQIDKDAGVICRVPAGPPPVQVKQQIEALFSALHGLPSALVTDREKAPLLSRLVEIRTHFSPELEEETLEELASDIGRLEGQYSDLLGQKRHILDSDLETMVRQMEQQRRDLDRLPELEGEIGPGLDFRRTLIDMQRELRRERDQLRKEIDQLRQAAVAAQQKLVAEGIIIQQGFQYVDAARKKGQELDRRCETLGNHCKGFKEWLKLLKDSDDLYKSLATLPELRTKLVDDIVRRINQNFARRRFDALAEDAEPFRAEFGELATQRETWVTAKRDEFNVRKDTLRDWLKEMKVDRPDFSARYDHLEHEQSYDDMYEQVLTIARQHVEKIRIQTEELRLDFKKARQIQWGKLGPEQREALKSLERDYTQLEKRRVAVGHVLDTLSLLEADADSLNASAGETAVILAEAEEYKTNLWQFLQPVPPKPGSEQAVLDLLRGQREMDLTDLVLKTEQDLTQVMEGLIGLYQGNQVIIKVTRRG